MNRMPYKGYIVEAHPHQLAENGHWTTNINIEKHTGDAVTSVNYSAGNTFETRDEATAACLQFGRRIIDGEIPKCSPP